MGLRIHCQFVPMAFTVQVVIQDSSVRLYSDTAKTLGDIYRNAISRDTADSGGWDQFVEVEREDSRKKYTVLPWTRNDRTGTDTKEVIP
jgi:hypothetical protein